VIVYSRIEDSTAGWHLFRLEHRRRIGGCEPCRRLCPRDGPGQAAGCGGAVWNGAANFIDQHIELPDWIRFSDVVIIVDSVKGCASLSGLALKENSYANTGTNSQTSRNTAISHLS